MMTKTNLTLSTVIFLFTTQKTFALSGVGSGSDLLAALEIEHSGGIKFGNIAPHLTQSGTVEITPGGTRICASSLTCLDTSPIGISRFDVIGQSSALYNINLPGQMVLTGIGGSSGHDMIATLQSSKLSGLVGQAGDHFNVGGILTVGANQKLGSYAGSYTVTVEYQ